MGKRVGMPEAKYAAPEGQLMTVGATKYDLLWRLYTERDDLRMELAAIRNEQALQSAMLASILGNQLRHQEVLMGRFDDVKTQAGANVAQLLKGFTEVTTLIATLKQQQAAQDQALKDAVAAQKAGDDAAFEAAMVQIQAIQSEETALIGQVEAIVPDAPPPEPTPVPEPAPVP